jgi:hypothetical protein
MTVMVVVFGDKGTEVTDTDMESAEVMGKTHVVYAARSNECAIHSARIGFTD